MAIPLHISDDGLPFITVVLRANGRSITIENVLVDTGSSTCVFDIDDVEYIGLRYSLDDVVHNMTGIGGDEQVIRKTVDVIAVGHLNAREFDIQMGALTYNYGIRGIIGFDFLRRTNAVLRAGELTLE